MRAADLAQAQSLIARRDEYQSMLFSVDGAADIRLCFGDERREILLSKEYSEHIRSDVVAALRKQVADIESQLSALGVEA